MRWTKQKKNGNSKIHNEIKIKKEKNGKKYWMNERIRMEWYSYLTLSHVATRRKIRQSDCLHGTSFSMWFQVRIGVYFLSQFLFFHRLFVCLGLRNLNWVQILMGLMCHLFFFFSFDMKTQWKLKNRESFWTRTFRMVLYYCIHHTIFDSY